MDPNPDTSAAGHRPSRYGAGEPVPIRVSLNEVAEVISDRELAALLDRLTSDQLRDILSIKQARERDAGPTHADEIERLRRLADPETGEAWAALEREPQRLANVAGLWRAMGVEDDLIGAWLVRRLLDSGVERNRAERLVMRAGVDWAPRTDADRWEAVAEAMIRSGFSPAQVRDAITSVRAREAVAA